MAARGQEVFAKQCARCHTVNGLANVPGPDLSDYGSEGWTHLRTADFIRDPQRYYPGTKMPAFGVGFAKSQDEALTDQQIDDVTAYISNLKKRADYLPENQRQ
jgi:cytochrome c oxidase subunit 2